MLFTCVHPVVARIDAGADKFSSLSAFLLILQLTSAGAIFSEELSSPFYFIGKGLPFYYGVR